MSTSPSPLVKRLNEIIAALPEPIVTSPDSTFKVTALFPMGLYRTIPVSSPAEFILKEFRDGKKGKDLILVLTPADSTPYEAIEIREKNIRDFSVVFYRNIVAMMSAAAGKECSTFGRAKSALLTAMEAVAIAEQVAVEEEKFSKAKNQYDAHPLWGAF